MEGSVSRSLDACLYCKMPAKRHTIELLVRVGLLESGRVEREATILPQDFSRKCSRIQKGTFTPFKGLVVSFARRS